MNITERRRLVAAVSVLAAILATGALVWVLLPGRTVLTKEQVAEQFATAYAAGDVPTGCTLAAGDALTKLADKGLCDRPADWHVTATLRTQCELPTGGTNFVYDTTAEVNRHYGFEVVVTGDAPKVTKLLTPNPRNTCQILGLGG